MMGLVSWQVPTKTSEKRSPFKLPAAHTGHSLGNCVVQDFLDLMQTIEKKYGHKFIELTPSTFPPNLSLPYR